MPVLHPGVLWPRHYWIPSIQWLCCGHCFKIIQLLLDAVTLFTMFTEKWRGTTHLFHTGEFFTQQFFAHSKILGKSSKLAFQDTSVNKFHTSLQMLFLFFIRHFSPALVCMKFCPQKKLQESLVGTRAHIFSPKGLEGQWKALCNTGVIQWSQMKQSYAS